MEYIRILTCKAMTTDEIWVRILIYNDCGTEKFLNVFFPVYQSKEMKYNLILEWLILSVSLFLSFRFHAPTKQTQHNEKASEHKGSRHFHTIKTVNEKGVASLMDTVASPARLNIQQR